ncbi:MAG: 3-keto-5-aminohexanoate cleavage protein [Thermodesulfobacteriota bacterium]
MEKLVVTAALTGNVPTKAQNPNLPVTPEEIAADARRCAEVGASVLHIHARDPQQKPTLEVAVFREIARRVKEQAPDLVIQFSTGARAGRDWEARVNPVRLLPEMGSFTTGSTNMPGLVYENQPQFLEYLAAVFQETGVKPEIEVFEAGMINNALYLVKKGLLDPPLHFNLVLGVPGAMPCSVRNLLFLSESLPAGSTWTFTGIGREGIPVAAAALALGGHVRVGLEDNLYLPDGRPAGNAGLVEKVVSLAREIGREVAGPEEARRILGLDPDKKDQVLGR